MPRTIATDVQPSVASLVRSIIDDTQQLVRQEVALARREVRDAFAEARKAGAMIGIALAFSGLGGLLLSFMLVELLHQYVLPHHEWACFGIVGGLLAVLGSVLFYSGRQRLDQLDWVPRHTVETLRADLQAASAELSPPSSILTRKQSGKPS